MDASSFVPPPVPTGPPPVPAVQKPVAAWRWWVHLLVIGSYPAAIHFFTPLSAWLLGFLRDPSARKAGAPALGDTVPDLLATSTVALVVFALVFAAGWFFSRATVDDLRLRWRGGWWPWPISLGYSVALRFLAGFAVVLGWALLWLFGQVQWDDFSTVMMENRPDVEALVSTGALANDTAYMVLSMTWLSFVVAGLREELWRAATFAALDKLFPRFGAKWPGKAVFILATATVFGLGHTAMGPLAVALTGVLGIGLGVIVMVHRSIWTAVLAHGFFNATTFALIPLLPRLLEYMKHLQP